MKNHIIIIAFLLGFNIPSIAQMTLAHTFPKPNLTEAAIVNLSISGKKIMIMRSMGAVGIGNPDTLYFYNLDYSLWKIIPCPGLPGMTGTFNFYHEAGNA